MRHLHVGFDGGVWRCDRQHPHGPRHPLWLNGCASLDDAVVRLHDLHHGPLSVVGRIPHPYVIEWYEQRVANMRAGILRTHLYDPRECMSEDALGWLISLTTRAVRVGMACQVKFNDNGATSGYNDRAARRDIIREASAGPLLGGPALEALSRAVGEPAPTIAALSAREIAVRTLWRATTTDSDDTLALMRSRREAEACGAYIDKWRAVGREADEARQVIALTRALSEVARDATAV